MSPPERRRSPRIRLQVPMFIRGVDSSGSTFLELTKTFDISSAGAFLACPRALAQNSLVQLTIPVPTPLVSALSRVPPETPPIQARVRRQASDGDARFVGVEFLKPLN